MKHFVLVHGACHGAWCWYKLVALLKQAGHRVTALDLGMKPIHEIRTLDDYMEPLMSLFVSLESDPRNCAYEKDDYESECEEKVILVGHSFGGIPISFAMERYPEKILAADFVSAYMPSSSSPPITLVQETFKRTPVQEFLDTSFHFEEPEKGPTVALFGPKFLATKVYQNCSPEDVELGKLLMRPEKTFNEELEKEGLLSEERYEKVDRVYIICEEDELVKKDFQLWMIERSPPSRVFSIPKADHMPMLSTPIQLSRCLLNIAHQY